MFKNICISLFVVSILLGVISCKDPLGMDDFKRTLINGDTIAIIDTVKIRIYDTLITDSIYIRDSIEFVFDTIYVPIDTSRNSLKSKHVRFFDMQFVEKYLKDSLGQYNWDIDIIERDMVVTYKKGYPEVELKLNLSNKLRGNQEYEAKRMEYVQIFNLHGFNLIPYKLSPYFMNGNQNSGKWSKLIVDYKPNNQTITYTMNSSTLLLYFLDTEIDEEGRLIYGKILIEAQIPHINPFLERNFIFLGLMSYEVVY